jgi:hypothetical protein
MLAQTRDAPIYFMPYLYRARSLVERFINKIKRWPTFSSSSDQSGGCST